MRNAGYFRTPTVFGDTVVFVSEDDLWSVALGGGVATRLTAGLGAAARPAISPDGQLIAFTSVEEGHPEVYVMPLAGGTPKRLTFLGSNSIVAGWTPDGDIVFRTDAGQPFVRIAELHAIDPAGGLPVKLPLGPANEISYGPNGSIALGRNSVDPARWKRYRGGTAGDLWVDAKGNGTFKRLMDFWSNFAHPLWVGKRIYFISDHEGIGNIYSVTPTGKDIRRHTDHAENYARFCSTDGTTIVYQHAAELWALDVASDAATRIEVDFPSPRTQRNRKFVDGDEYMQWASLHPQGHSIAINARGKQFSMGLWEGGVLDRNGDPGARMRMGSWLADGETFIAVSDEGGEEHLVTIAKDGTRTHYDKLDLGQFYEVVPNPKRNLVAVTNHRLEVIVVDLDKKTSKVVDTSRFRHPGDLSWSPDGGWLAYAMSESVRTYSIKIYDTASNRTTAVTEPNFSDHSPSWDPEGKYLFFISFRTFDPVYDEVFFDLGFPRGSRPYVISLRADVPNPLLPDPKGFGNGDAGKDAKDGKDDADKAKDKKKDDKAKDEPIKIDLDGIARRIAALPVPVANYSQLHAIKGKVLFTSFPIQGALSQGGGEGQRGSLEVFDLTELKHEVLIGGINAFDVSQDGATLLYIAGRRLRALKAGDRPDEKFANDPPSRKSGWIDLKRVRAEVDPGAEWVQMYREAWRLQRDNFWTPDMSKIDWPRVYDRYLPLVDKVATRSEFSDLMWEMQGELGTSHAYESGGDYRRPPAYAVGQLGADFELRNGRWAIAHIVQGDQWDESQSSPLAAIGTQIKEGDTILAINGRALDAKTPPQAALVSLAGHTVELTVGDKSGRKPRQVRVKTLRADTPARYREWVETNREYVHEQTNGRVGYVHVPNMGALGYSEFHRYYNAEVERDGLIVDVRYNGGGHVSQILLEKLARKRIGYDIKRWGVPEPYPSDSLIGPVVCLTNEHAGSDGDIFTHCFKLMGLGPVVGKRTWGGVVGIWPRHSLADGSLTTQPEFSFWFTDVGWGVENYGTDPDYDIDITPQDHAAGRDPQMAKSLALINAELKKNPPKLPDFSKRRSLALPKLPKRP
jgi:tricorn protease